MQFKDKTTQKLYNEVVDPYVKVASVTDDYVTALASLRSFFPALAQQKEDMLKAYATGQKDALEAQEAKAIEARKKTLMGWERHR